MTISARKLSLGFTYVIVWIMKIRMFTQRGSMLTWKIDISRMELEISTWLSTNMNISVREIRHDISGCFWFPPQYIVTIYYT